MLISLSKILLNIDQSQPWNDDALESLAALEDFVVDSYGSRDPDLRQLFSPDKELRFKTSFRLPFVAVEGQRLRIRDLPVHVQEVNSAMQFHVMRTMNPDHAYYICFDQLDLGFDPNQKEYSLRLIGLLLAARDLFLDARDEHKKKLSPVVFLRDDIYQDLQFEDKNKITENFMTEVEWRESEGTLTLKELMGSRFAEVLADGGEAVGWDDVFDESREMPSRQTKYKHICDRTFLRPRDMIKFCNEVLIAHKAGADQEAAKFGNAALHQARDPYSDYLLNELDDEIAKHVPDYREYLEVLKEVGSVQFTLTEFSANWRRRAALSQIEPAAGLASLFEFSVIGYLKPGGRGGGSEYVWRYLDPRARFNAGAESFRVHAGFKEALDLVRT
jgi:hypothetical protein